MNDQMELAMHLVVNGWWIVPSTSDMFPIEFRKGDFAWKLQKDFTMTNLVHMISEYANSLGSGCVDSLSESAKETK